MIGDDDEDLDEDELISDKIFVVSNMKFNTDTRWNTVIFKCDVYIKTG